MTPLSITTQTAYAELLDQLVAFRARRSVGHAPGAFVTKEIKGRTYYYFQYSTPGGTARQAYVGPKSRALERLVKRFANERAEAQADRARVEELAAILRAGGAAVTDAASARVIAALADGGLFELGGVLVGTHAFVVLGNVLGVRWDAAASRTEDVDIGVERVLEVGVPELHADLPRLVESLEMGFLPVPALSPKDPSTSFKVRGRGLRVDLVTPARGAKTDRPVHIERLNAAAAPVRYLDFVLEDAQPAAVVDGGGVLVAVPQPARFGLHKLLVARDRPAAFQTKAAKDLLQATLVLEALEELRPGDLASAWRAARARGKAWARALDDAAKLVKSRSPTLTKRFRELSRS